MGTQVLVGSKGTYRHPKIDSQPDIFRFTVTMDTCLEAEFLPIIFNGAAEGCWILMSQSDFDPDAKYKDY
jgi:hypothetical protein